LVYGTIYRKTPYLMRTSMVSCRFSLQAIHWEYTWFSDPIYQPSLLAQAGDDLLADDTLIVTLDQCLVSFCGKGWREDGNFHGTHRDRGNNLCETMW
jgi:hypothetical protein